MIPEAMRIFPEGSIVSISIENGKINTHDIPPDQVMALKNY
jgi:hypothetical protein